MKIGAAYPSEYLKSDDLKGKDVRVTMSHVEMKDIGGEPKPCLYFLGSDKGMVLNKTNAGRIADMYGDETDHWQGKQVVLYVDRVDFQGRRVDAIRVKYQSAAQQPQQHPPQHTNGHTNGNGHAHAPAAPAHAEQVYDSVDEIPF